MSEIFEEYELEDTKRFEKENSGLQTSCNIHAMRKHFMKLLGIYTELCEIVLFYGR